MMLSTMRRRYSFVAKDFERVLRRSHWCCGAASVFPTWNDEKGDEGGMGGGPDLAVQGAGVVDVVQGLVRVDLVESARS